MRIDAELVTRLEKLSKIELSAAEKETAQKDLQEVLRFMEKLAELDTDGIGQDSFCVTGIDALREDVLNGPEKPEAILENAKEKRDNCFVVPKTVE